MISARYCLVLQALFLASQSFAHEHGELELFFRANSFAFSEAMPVAQLVDELKGAAPKKGDIAFTYNRAEVGVGLNDFELSFFQRYDYYIDFSPDTIDLWYGVENATSINKNRVFDILLRANHQRSRGATLAYTHKLDQSFQVKLAVSYLYADRLVDGVLAGSISTSDEDYMGDVYVDYSYTEDILFDREVEGVNGDGYALDVFLAWDASDQLHINFSLEDLISEIIWEQVPVTNGRLSSNRVDLNDDGTITSKPNLTGNQGFRDYTQRLPVRADLKARYHLSQRYAGVARWQRYDDFDYPSIGIAYSADKKNNLEVTYNFITQGAMFAFKSRLYSFHLLSDQLSLSSAKTLSVGFSLHWTL